jgi:hypothetical protein
LEGEVLVSAEKESRACRERDHATVASGTQRGTKPERVLGPGASRLAAQVFPGSLGISGCPLGCGRVSECGLCRGPNRFFCGVGPVGPAEVWTTFAAAEIRWQEWLVWTEEAGWFWAADE